MLARQVSREPGQRLCQRGTCGDTSFRFSGFKILSEGASHAMRNEVTPLNLRALEPAFEARPRSRVFLSARRAMF